MQNKMLVTILFLVGSIFLFFVGMVRAVNADIIINEICTRNCVSSKVKQWIEIYNYNKVDDGQLDISDWKFYVEGESNHTISTTTLTGTFIIEAGEYAVITNDYLEFLNDHPNYAGKLYDSTWEHSLDQTRAIGLKDKDGNFIDGPFTYPAVQSYSLEKIDAAVESASSTNWKEHPNGNSLGSINYWTTYVSPTSTNQSPLAVINGPTSTTVNETVQFSAASSTDPEGADLVYQWTINTDEDAEGNELVFNYHFTTSGIFTVSLQITDDQDASASTSADIIVNSTSAPPLAETFPIIYINELLPDPSASTEHEWIELYNSSTSSADLTGWTLSDSVGVRSSPTGTIAGQGFFVIEFSNVLNNSGDTVTLKNSSGEIADQIVYGISSLKSPAKGYSLARTIDGGGNFVETTTPTKNSANQINQPVVNQPSSGGGSSSATQPTITITENLTAGAKIIINELLPNPKGADTTDEFIELKNLDSQRINLTGWVLSDASGSKFTIKEGSISLGGFLVFKRSATNLSLNNSGSEEVKLIDPTGAVIDRISYSGKAVEGESFARNLQGVWEWTVKNTPGAENTIEARNLPPSVAVDYAPEVEVGETVLFDASDTFDPENDALGFLWNIGGEKFTGAVIHYIFDRAGKRVVNLQVSDSHNNQVARKITLSVIRNEESEEIVESSGNTLTNQSVIGKSTASTASAKLYSPVQTVNLAGIKQLEVGDRIKVQGTVAVLPGIFGSQYFYIVDQAGSAGSLQAGVQIYMYKKDFPALAVGDQVAVQGELSQAYGEWRVKTKEKKDIQIIKHGQLADLAVSEIPSVEEETVGQLVKLRGEITELKSAYMYIDDGSGELKVYFKKGAGIDKKNFQLGDFVAVSGIVGKNKDGVQLLPRSTADINKLENSQELIISAPGQSADDSKNMAETYLTATAGGLTSILIGLLARARGALALSILKKTGKLALIIFRRTPKV